jgi:hypothetical protein
MARCCSSAALPASAAAFSHDDMAMIMPEPITIATSSIARLAPSRTCGRKRAM